MFEGKEPLGSPGLQVLRGEKVTEEKLRDFERFGLKGMISWGDLFPSKQE